MSKLLFILTICLSFLAVFSSCSRDIDNKDFIAKNISESKNLDGIHTCGYTDENDAPEGYCAMYKANSFGFEFLSVNAVDFIWCGVLSEPVYKRENTDYVPVAVYITDIYDSTFQNYFYENGGTRNLHEIDAFHFVEADYSIFENTEKGLDEKGRFAVIFFPELMAKNYNYGTKLLAFLDLFSGIHINGEAKNCFAVAVDRKSQIPSVFEFDDNGCLSFDESYCFQRDRDTSAHMMRIMDIIVPTNIAFSRSEELLPVFESGISGEQVKEYIDNAIEHSSYVQKIYVKIEDVTMFEKLGWSCYP